MKAILHIGTEKTGTTTIQNGLRINENLLKEQGFYSPRSLAGGLGSHNHVKLTNYALNDDKLNDLRKIDGITNLEQLEQYRRDIYQEFSKELKQCSQETVLLTNEHCSSRLVELEEIKRLKYFLTHFFDEIEIMIYLRRQEELFISGYSTAVKSGQTYTLPGVKAFSSNKNRYDYAHILNKWESVFGQENISVNIYDSEVLYGKDILSDYAHKIGAEGVEIPKKRFNSSLNLPKLEFLRRLNKHFASFQGNEVNAGRGGIVTALERIEFDGPGIYDMLDNSYIGVYDEVNKEIAKKYFDSETLFPSSQRNYDQKVNGVYDLSEEEFFGIFAEIYKFIKGKQN